MSSASPPQVRIPLSRERVLQAALRYIDEHGLDALSMHRLAADLGVKAMSLYNHVASKDDLLDGLVEQLWAEIPGPAAGDSDRRGAIRTLVHALRELVQRHPNAAPLLMSRQVLPVNGLRLCEAYLRVLHVGGVPEEVAAPLLRTVVSYGFGYSLTELSCFLPCGDGEQDELNRIRRVGALLPADTPDHLVQTALTICGGCDMRAQFELGVELMLRGLDSYLP